MQRDPLRRKVSQGKPIYGVDIKIADEDGAELLRDGHSSGHFMVKGPWVIQSYFRDERAILEDGWFNTGDLATMDENNALHLTDRAKDVIKSGCEWIISIDIENLTMNCPGVIEAAVIGIPHPTWEERPLLVVVGDPCATDKAAILSYLDGRIAKW